MFDRMLNFLRIQKKRKSATNLSGHCSDAASLRYPFHHQNVKCKLVLPRSLDEVAAAAHRNTPKQLPGEDASEDDVRYFLYEVLTHKDHGLVRLSPQWILETCMSWHGGGHVLRSLPSDSYQQLCPLHKGHADIDWIKCRKFFVEDMPPCGTRGLIAATVQTVVANLKSSETGHRSPGWQNSKNVRGSAISRSTDCLTAQKPTSRPDLLMPSLAAASAYPTREQSYSLGNQSAQQFNSTPSLNICRDPLFTQHGSAFVLSQCTPSPVGPYPEQLGRANNLLPSRADKENRLNSPPSSPPPASLPSPALSYAYSDRSMSQTSGSTRVTLSVRHSVSTARTSPPSSENENSCWCSKSGRPRSMSQSGCSISQSSMDEHIIPSEACGTIASRASVAIPSRYKMRSNPRSFDPQIHMAQLRNFSYNTTAVPRSSPLNSSYDAFDRHGDQQGSTISPEVRHYPLHHEPPSRPSIRPTPTYSMMPRSYPTPPQRLPTPTTLATANPIFCSRTSSVRPLNNHAIDARIFGNAEYVDYKIWSAPRNPMIVDQVKRLGRGRSDDVLHMRVRNHGNKACDRVSVGPHIRLRDPQTGAPRLTMVKTIEQHQRQGKQRLEGQRRVDQHQRRLKTVIETIEEQEIIGGRAQRGVDNVQHGWASYY